MEKIRLLVIDDHPIVSEALELFLNQDPGLLVLATARDAESGLEKLKHLNPELVVLDLFMPKLDGFQAIELYLEARPDVKILVFTARTEEHKVYQALRAGAHGYVVKGSSTKELVEAIYYVSQGGYWVSPQFSPGLVTNYLKNVQVGDTEKSAYEQLSGREQEVFRLIVSSYDTKKIANILCISETTVAKHRISLMRKLEIDNVVELTKFALRSGLIEI
jgi:two-component system, NarL family, response regulator NreC